MKFIKYLLFLTISLQSFGQDRICKTDVLNTLEVKQSNLLKNYKNYNFSNLWLKTSDDFIFGIIGTEHQRFLIKFIMVEKNIIKNDEYFVYGKTSVKSNICDFVGKITLKNIKEISSINYGVDDEYKNSGIKFQGLLTAEYEFFENSTQKHSGFFSGTTQTLIYIDKNNNVKYNDISINSDGYFNNSFVGKWKMYNSGLEKICNWGDYRVPNSNCDFDIGVGEFNVSEKYIKNGWLDIVLKNKMPNQAIIEPKTNINPKRWWEE
jgi:hypothetical protein